MRDLVRLPKAHLHLHFTGSARPATIVELANRAGVDYRVPTTFSSFAEFEAAYQEVVGFVRQPEDVVRLCRELVEDEARQGVLYTQPMFIPIPRFGMTAAEIFALMHAAFASAAVDRGIEIGFIIAAVWTWPLEMVEEWARFAAERTDEGVVGFGLCGIEPTGGYARWATASAIAREAGLLVIPHAGEFGGAGTVAAALDALAADRIHHGIHAVEDPAVMTHLAAEAIPCDLCPTSNVVLGVAPAISDLPVRQFLDAGVPITLNADDQLFFGHGAADEYAAVRDAFHLTDDELAAIARTSANVSGAPVAIRQRLLRGIDAWLAAPA